MSGVVNVGVVNVAQSLGKDFHRHHYHPYPVPTHGIYERSDVWED